MDLLGKLVAETPAGTHLLLRGNPFADGLGDLDTVLSTAVHRDGHLESGP